MLVLHDLRETQDGVQRRAQFMAHVGQESGFGLRGLARLFRGGGKAARHGLQFGTAAGQLANDPARIKDQRRGHDKGFDGNIEHRQPREGRVFEEFENHMDTERRQHHHTGHGQRGPGRAQPFQSCFQAGQRMCDGKLQPHSHLFPDAPSRCRDSVSPSRLRRGFASSQKLQVQIRTRLSKPGFCRFSAGFDPGRAAMASPIHRDSLRPCAT